MTFQTNTEPSPFSNPDFKSSKSLLFAHGRFVGWKVDVLKQKLPKYDDKLISPLHPSFIFLYQVESL